MKKSKHGHRGSMSGGKSMSGKHHAAYNSLYGDHKGSKGDGMKGRAAAGGKKRDKRLEGKSL